MFNWRGWSMKIWFERQNNSETKSQYCRDLRSKPRRRSWQGRSRVIRRTTPRHIGRCKKIEVRFNLSWANNVSISRCPNCHWKIELSRNCRLPIITKTCKVSEPKVHNNPKIKPNLPRESNLIQSSSVIWKNRQSRASRNLKIWCTKKR